jgi:uncharacterized protein (DUF427 family)
VPHRPGPGPPLLPRSARPALLILIGACALIVAGLGLAVHGQSHAGWLDAGPDTAIIGALGPHPRIAGDLIDVADPERVVIICAVLAVVALASRRWRGALLVVLAVPLASAITEFALKPLVDRHYGVGLAFPSGHLTGVTAMAGVTIVLAIGPAHLPLPRLARWLLVAAAVAAVAAVVLGVIALRYHYLTDTIGGAAVGTAVVTGTALTLDALLAAGAGVVRWPARNDRRPGEVATSMPGHTITITPSTAHVEVTLNGTKLAESDRAVVLNETGAPARYYLPREDVRADLLKETPTHTTCPFKGQADYWSAEVGGEVHEDVVWSYATPIPEAEGIAGLLAFYYPEKVELTVDGATAS